MFETEQYAFGNMIYWFKMYLSDTA